MTTVSISINEDVLRKGQKRAKALKKIRLRYSFSAYIEELVALDVTEGILDKAKEESGK